MKWFKKILYRWTVEGNQLDNSLSSEKYSNSILSVTEERSLNSTGIRLEFYKANGGYVIETRKYDRRKDENNVQLYLITEQQNLSDELSKIITMESLR